MHIENERIMHSSQMWHEMQTKRHFITNLISCLQIWAPRPSWPDPTRPVGRVKDRATLRQTAQPYTWYTTYNSLPRRTAMTQHTWLSRRTAATTRLLRGYRQPETDGAKVLPTSDQVGLNLASIHQMAPPEHTFDSGSISLSWSPS